MNNGHRPWGDDEMTKRRNDEGRGNGQDWGAAFSRGRLGGAGRAKKGQRRRPPVKGQVKVLFLCLWVVFATLLLSR